MLTYQLEMWKRILSPGPFSPQKLTKESEAALHAAAALAFRVFRPQGDGDRLTVTGITDPGTFEGFRKDYLETFPGDDMTDKLELEGKKKEKE